MIGKRFGRLLVVAPGPGRIEPCSGLPRRNWECLCECGRRTVCMETNLKFGRSTSCGHHSVSNYRHGETANDATTPEWRLWRSIITRCFNSGCAEYRNYGGRGISMDPAWRASYATFLAAVGRRPGPGYTLDRRNNDLGYVPGNVRWATRKEQARNTRRTRYVNVDGQKVAAMDIVEAKGLPVSTFYGRLQLGWSTEEACGLVARAGAK